MQAGRYSAIGVWIAVTLIALFPGGHATMATFQWGDKIEHFLAFGVLAFLFSVFWAVSRGRLALLLLVYGCGIELFQMYIPGHLASFFDILADLVGIGSGLLALAILERMTMAAGIKQTD
ncbi:hypothetical protein E0L29_09320 [Chlorobium sp. N1]|nr:hypothetical protein E0L29_09320 [Chlorobium sp. N1]